MRIRTVKPEFWTHPVMAKQPAEVQLLAIGLLNYADDGGYFYADPLLIRAALRPYDRDESKVHANLSALHRIGFVDIREHISHGWIGLIVSFQTHQRIDKPKASPISQFYENSTELTEDQVANPRPVPDESETNPGSLREQSRLERKGRERKVKERGTSADASRQANLAIPGITEPTSKAPDWDLAPGFPLPEHLRSQEALEAAQEWLAYKKEQNHRYKPTGMKALLAGWGRNFDTPQDLADSIRHSIEQNWQGVHAAPGIKNKDRRRTIWQQIADQRTLVDLLTQRLEQHPGNRNSIRFNEDAPQEVFDDFSKKFKELCEAKEHLANLILQANSENR